VCRKLLSTAPALVVLAAGIGARYGGLKQMDPVGPGGEAVLDYAVFDAKRAGFGKVIFVIRKQIEQDFRQLFGRRFARHVEVDYAFQALDMVPAGRLVPPGRQKPWGTGHAVLCAAPVLDRPFAVINADDFYGAESFRVLARFLTQQTLPNSNLFAMVGFQLDRTLSEHGTVARGLCQTDAEGYLSSVEELTAIEKQPGGGARNKEADASYRSLTGREVVSMNCWGFSPGLFDGLRRQFGEFLDGNEGSLKAEFYLPTAINALIRDGQARVKVLPTPCHWFGVTYREDRPVVIESIRALVRAGEYPERLWD
jgi:UTP-glucose-1-phosphate uridylyltransferase